MLPAGRSAARALRLACRSVPTHAHCARVVGALASHVPHPHSVESRRALQSLSALGGSGAVLPIDDFALDEPNGAIAVDEPASAMVDAGTDDLARRLLEEFVGSEITTDEGDATLSTIDILLANADLDRAQDKFDEHLRNDQHFQFPPFVTRALLAWWASSGNLPKARRMFDYIRASRHPIGPHEYACMLDVYASCDDLEGLAAILREMEAAGLDARRIRAAHAMDVRQAALVESQIARLVPGFALDEVPLASDIAHNMGPRHFTQPLCSGYDEVAAPVEPHAAMQRAADGGRVVFKPYMREQGNIQGNLAPLLESLGALEDTSRTPEALQWSLETKTIELARKRYLEEVDAVMRAGRAADLPMVRRLVAKWHGEVTASVAREQARVAAGYKVGAEATSAGSTRRQLTAEQMTYGPFLTMLPANALTSLTLTVIVSRLFSQPENGAFTGPIAAMVGRRVYTAYVTERVRVQRRGKNGDADAVKMIEKVYSDFIRLSRHAHNSRHDKDVWNSLRHKHPDFFREHNIPEWPMDVVIKVGAALVKHVLDHAKLFPMSESAGDTYRLNRLSDDKAFYQSYVTEGGKLRGVIRINPRLGEVIRREGNAAWFDPFLDSKMLPMVVPPVPWTSAVKGGYLVPSATGKSAVIRARNSNLQLRAVKEAEQQIDPVLDAINTLQSVAWRVNERVLDVSTTVWNSGGDAALDITPQEDEPDIPLPENYASLDLKARSELQRARRAIRQRNAELHSERCDLQYKFVVAHFFRNRTFYLPHSLDFRGRAYPIPPYLSHMGGDLTRGLLLFDEAKPLGPDGLYWLKIHLANNCGADKLSLDERVRFADRHMEEVFDSARDPLGKKGGRMWWKRSENPWQTLATCFDLSDAIASGDPSSYMSRMHVHMDGSCNGLQHYAALGGDLLGAEQVNLIPSERPQDVYQGVCDLVKQAAARDASEHKDPQTREVAAFVAEKLTRKVVKQTVMTNVYGVTYIGGRMQIEKHLREQEKEVPTGRFSFVAAYITRLVFAALDTMFMGAREIQDWLTNSARSIAQARQPVRWVTPLGLPVVQPYLRKRGVNVGTSLHSMTVSKEVDPTQVSVARQKMAFPPNFIHSLDSTHMLMTATACREAGITFAAVHDSFWAHACDTAEMNRILRRTFVDLHSRPLMENLRDSFVRQYEGARDMTEKGRVKRLTFPDVPKRGTFDLSEVERSAYFFD